MRGSKATRSPTFALVVHDLEAAIEEGAYDRALESIEKSSAFFTEWGVGADLDRIERVLRDLEEYRPDDPWVLYLLGWVWFNRRQHEIARTTIVQAKSAFGDLGDRRAASRGEFLCHLALGMVDQAGGRNTEARQSFEHALASGYLEIEPRPLSADEERWVEKDTSGLIEFWLLAGEVFTRMGLRISAARAQHNIGTIVLDLGEPAPGRLFMERALELKQSGASELSTALTLNSLGCCERLLGLLQRAAGHLEDAVDITRSHGHQTHLSYALNNLAEVRRDQGDRTAALELYAESVRLKEEEENTYGIAYSWLSEADLHLMAGEAAPAAELADRALRLRVPGAGELEEARMRAAKARASFATHGDGGAVAEDLHRAAALFASSGTQADLMTASWWLAAARLDLGDRPGAASAAERALEIAELHQLDHVLAGQALSTPSVLGAHIRAGLTDSGASAMARLQALVERSPWQPDLGDDQETTRVEATLFGGMTVEVGGAAVSTADWRSRKAVSLMAMLIHEAGDPLHRETAAERLWPDAEPDKARRNLNVALSTVRRELEETVPGAGTLVDRQGSYYRLAAPSGLSTDVAEFRSLYQAVNAAERQGDLATALATAEAALEKAVGEYLADEHFADWVQSERSRLAELVLDLRVRAADWCLGNGDTSTAIYHATAALSADPWRERAWGALVRAHADAGDRGAALRAYERCEAVFQDELGLSPSAELEKLAEELRG